MMMNSTVLTPDTLGHPVWADISRPACDERLITVADANVAGISGAPTEMSAAWRVGGSHVASRRP